jgi:hypothetical protein
MKTFVIGRRKITFGVFGVFGDELILLEGGFVAEDARQQTKQPDFQCR